MSLRRFMTKGGQKMCWEGLARNAASSPRVFIPSTGRSWPNRRSGTSHDFHVFYSENNGAQFTADSRILRRSISVKGKELGSIAIVSDLTELQVKMQGYNEISALALLLSVAATLFISSRLLRLITEPILQLAEVAGKVSSEENFALRAIPQSNDEVGTLIHSFLQTSQ